MSTAVVVTALVTVGAFGALAWLAQRWAAREAHKAVQSTLETALRMVEMRPEVPRPPKPEVVVVPAPDLGPYLRQLAEMGQGMARELAAGISLVVAGPPQASVPAQAEGQVVGGAEEPEEEPYVPPWDTDDSWGLGEPVEDAPPEWDAAWAAARNGGSSAPFGGGGIRLPDNEGL